MRKKRWRCANELVTVTAPQPCTIPWPTFTTNLTRPEQAIEHLKEAVIIFTEIGGDAGDMQPEVWKLTIW